MFDDVDHVCHMAMGSFDLQGSSTATSISGRPMLRNMHLASMARYCFALLLPKGPRLLGTSPSFVSTPDMLNSLSMLVNSFDRLLRAPLISLDIETFLRQPHYPVLETHPLHVDLVRLGALPHPINPTRRVTDQQVLVLVSNSVLACKSDALREPAAQPWQHPLSFNQCLHSVFPPLLALPVYLPLGARRRVASCQACWGRLAQHPHNGVSPVPFSSTRGMTEYICAPCRERRD